MIRLEKFVMKVGKNAALSIVFLFRIQQLKQNYTRMTDPLTHTHTNSRLEAHLCCCLTNTVTYSAQSLLKIVQNSISIEISSIQHSFGLEVQRIRLTFHQFEE